MNQRIIEGLERIEQEEGVRILYACELGSRAWGFPSKDSDYDVRFIYIRPLEWYLSIVDQRDVIERPINELLDLHGWDLKKALNLLHKSNQTLIEWLQSPIVYMDKYQAADRIRAIVPLTFSPRSSMYHYLNMAKRNYKQYFQGRPVKVKKYFTVLRPILSCEWIEQYHTAPPVEFDKLVVGVRGVPENNILKNAIQELIDLKIAGVEVYDGPNMNVIAEYVEEKIDEFEQRAPLMEEATGCSVSELDVLFHSTLEEVWGG